MSLISVAIDINNVVLWNNELCQHLGDLRNSVNLHFPTDQCMMQETASNSMKKHWEVLTNL